MKCITEKEINHYLFTGDIPQAVKDHLKECHFCNERFEAAVKFQESLVKQFVISPFEKEPKEFNKIFENTIKTININFDSALYDGFQKSVLVAETETNEQMETYKTIVLKISVDGKILVRVLENLGTGAKTLYLIAENSKLFKNKNVQVGDNFYHTDENGKIELGWISIDNNTDITII